MCNIKMSYLLVNAMSVERQCAEYPHDGTKYVHLLQVDIDKIRKLALDIINGFPDRYDRKAGRQGNQFVEVFTSCHWYREVRSPSAGRA